MKADDDSDESECHNKKIHNIGSFCALHLLAELFCLKQTIEEAAVPARVFQLF